MKSWLEMHNDTTKEMVKTGLGMMSDLLMFQSRVMSEFASVIGTQESKEEVKKSSTGWKPKTKRGN